MTWHTERSRSVMNTGILTSLLHCWYWTKIAKTTFVWFSPIKWQHNGEEWIWILWFICALPLKIAGRRESWTIIAHVCKLSANSSFNILGPSLKDVWLSFRRFISQERKLVECFWTWKIKLRLVTTTHWGRKMGLGIIQNINPWGLYSEVLLTAF